MVEKGELASESTVSRIRKEHFPLMLWLSTLHRHLSTSVPAKATQHYMSTYNLHEIGSHKAEEVPPSKSLTLQIFPDSSAPRCQRGLSYTLVSLSQAGEWLSPQSGMTSALNHSVQSSLHKSHSSRWAGYYLIVALWLPIRDPLLAKKQEKVILAFCTGYLSGLWFLPHIKLVTSHGVSQSPTPLSTTSGPHSMP